jgi:hypothetical protein
LKILIVLSIVLIYSSISASFLAGETETATITIFATNTLQLPQAKNQQRKKPNAKRR